MPAGAKEKRLSATGAFAFVKLLRGVDGDLLAVLAQTLKADDAVSLGEQGIIRALAHVRAGVDVSAALAHRITRRLSQARRSEELPWLRPDGKSQVTIEYDHSKFPKKEDCESCCRMV